MQGQSYNVRLELLWNLANVVCQQHLSVWSVVEYIACHPCCELPGGTVLTNKSDKEPQHRNTDKKPSIIEAKI